VKNFSLLFLLAFFVVSCGPKIYTSTEFGNALSKHKMVAILPAEVTIQLRPNQMKDMTEAQLIQMRTTTGYDIQEKMYGWFLRRSDKYTVRFQDVTKTNSLLKENGIRYEDLSTFDRSKLAKILGVDAVVQNRSNMEKPMSEGAAVAVGLLVGAWGNTNKVRTNIDIHDGKSGDLLWKYDYEAAGSVGSSTTRMVDALMKNASKKFPYVVK
jgi:hypothetical protein